MVSTLGRESSVIFINVKNIEKNNYECFKNAISSFYFFHFIIYSFFPVQKYDYFKRQFCFENRLMQVWPNVIIMAEAKLLK
jgi:hypothetical protein